ncbi:MAG TPA: alpha/beta fold hydrolase [Bacteroidota bacterium]|nr:alpha/beta fold hydrolase [Bacteroidota bacterium]
MKSRTIVKKSLFVTLILLIPMIACAMTPLLGSSGKLKVEEGVKVVNGTELYYKTIGQGTPIVILHGGPGLDHTYLLPQMAALARRHRLIFFDQRASGRSSSLVDTSTMRMGTFVEDLEGIRKAFNIGKMNLLGHSWGGLVAMFYAIKYPDNLGTLMLVNSTPASSGWRNASFVLMNRRQLPEDSIAQAALTRTEEFHKRTSKAMSEFFKILFRTSFYNRKYIDSLRLSLDTSFTTKSRIVQHLNNDSTLLNYDIFHQLAVVHCPTLIIGSSYDMVAPEANERLHQSIQGSELVVIDSCGHFPFIEAPGKFFGTIEGFLKKAEKVSGKR